MEGINWGGGHDQVKEKKMKDIGMGERNGPSIFNSGKGKKKGKLGSISAAEKGEAQEHVISLGTPT